MNILIVTQAIDENDSVLGFFTSWVREFTAQADKVTVLCLRKGAYTLPNNVSVYSLGKEHGGNRFVYVYRFLRLIISKRKEYDAVFVHMNTVYILLGSFIWHVLGKKVGLWYAHGEVKWDIIMASKMADILFTSTEKGLRIESPKKHIVGQGIDTIKFAPGLKNEDDMIFRMITVGRISMVKGLDVLVDAIERLSHDKDDFVVEIIGVPITEKDKQYYEHLKIKISEKKLENFFDFRGAMNNTEIVPYLQKADLFVSMSETGSLDKALLEAMACGTIAVGCNDALREILGEYSDILVYKKRDAYGLYNKIVEYVSLDNQEKQKIQVDLHGIVKTNHSLQNLVKQIIDLYNKNR